jgi:hypothetical protein
LVGITPYANLETNYLLQRIEEHPGITIFTTNIVDGRSGSDHAKYAGLALDQRPSPRRARACQNGSSVATRSRSS